MRNHADGGLGQDPLLSSPAQDCAPLCPQVVRAQSGAEKQPRRPRHAEPQGAGRRASRSVPSIAIRAAKDRDVSSQLAFVPASCISLARSSNLGGRSSPPPPPPPAPPTPRAAGRYTRLRAHAGTMQGSERRRGGAGGQREPGGGQAEDGRGAGALQGGYREQSGGPQGRGVLLRTRCVRRRGRLRRGVYPRHRPPGGVPRAGICAQGTQPCLLRADTSHAVSAEWQGELRSAPGNTHGSRPGGCCKGPAWPAPYPCCGARP